MSVIGVFLVRMRENTDQKNCEYGHFPRSDKFSLKVNSAPFSLKILQKTLQNKSFKGALKRTYSEKIHQFTEKTPVIETLFSKPSRKKGSVTVVFPEI